MFPCLSPGAVGIALPWEDCLPLAKEHGFLGIDVPLDPRRPAAWYREQLEAHGLVPGGTGLPFHMFSTPAQVDAALEALPAACQAAREIGLSRFATWIMPFSDEVPRKENFRRHAELLGRAARIMDEYGCRLGLEFIGPKTLREGHRYPFVRTMEEMLDLCEATGPNVGLLLDAYHWYTSLGTLEDLLALEARQVVYVHVNDAPAGIPVDRQLDQVRALPGDTGVIPLKAFLGALQTVGYDGPVVAEPFVKALAEMPPAEAARRVGQSLRAIWP